MIRIASFLVAAAALTVVAPEALGQAGRPQSSRYLFVASVDDARAIWVNPAGLASVPDYSVTADFTLENASTGSLRLGQWTAGFNSRGLAFGYQRDRFVDDPGTVGSDPFSTSAYRLAAAAPWASGAFGASFSIYRGNSTGTELAGSVGVQLRVGQNLTVGGVFENIGRPILGSVKAPLSGVAGFAWFPKPQVLEIAGELRAVGGIGAQNTTLFYRGGLHFSPDASFPVSVFGALDLGSSPTFRGFSVGVSVGTADRIGALATGVRTGGTVDVSEFGLFGIASRGPLRPRP